MDFIRDEDIRLLQQWIRECEHPVVVGHTHPDGDALGATAALCLYLKNLAGKDVACAFSDNPPENLLFILPEEIPYCFHNRDAAATERRIREADLVFLLDCNAFHRTESLEEPLKASPARKVLIDHHLNPDRDSFGLSFSTPHISSASEVLYWILKALGQGPEGDAPAVAKEKADAPLGASPSGQALPNDIGSALLTGMTTDTNNFANSVFPSTFRMASELMAAGVDRDAILQQIYNCYRENRVRLMGYMQSERMVLLPEGAAYMVLTREIQQRYDMHEGETEGLVNVPLTIGKVRLSLFLKEDKGHFRVSIRSKKGTSAQQLAMQYFHGGGHENAAGGKLFIGEDIPCADDAPAYIEKAVKAFLA